MNSSSQGVIMSWFWVLFTFEESRRKEKRPVWSLISSISCLECNFVLSNNFCTLYRQQQLELFFFLRALIIHFLNEAPTLGLPPS